MADYELCQSVMANNRSTQRKCGFFHDCNGERRRLAGIFALLCAIFVLSGCGGNSYRAPESLRVPEVSTAYRQEVVMTALGLMGSPYRYGGNSPATGFDCSGLVNYVFGMAAGTPLPRTSGAQAVSSRRISRRELREGDLVFFNTSGRANSHVGIYVGDGRFVNAPSSGGRVRIDTLDNPYFARRFDSARTLFARR